LTGFAVKVTDVPVQTGLADGEMETEAVVPLFAVIVMAFDFAGL
jgi:hypothetical protein